MRQSNLVNSPYRPDLTEWKSGGRITPEICFYLYCRDGTAAFRGDTMIDDAIRNWIIVKGNEDIVKKNKKELKRLLKWYQIYGWTLQVNYLAGKNVMDQLLPEVKGAEKQAFVKVEAHHPYVKGQGGVKDWHADTKTGKISEFHVFANAEDEKGEWVKADRCRVWSYGNKCRNWQGMSCYAAGLDDLIGMKTWRAAAAVRAREFSQVVYEIVKEVLNGQDAKSVDFTDEEISSIDEAYEGTRHSLTVGTHTNVIAAPLETGQLETLFNQSMSSIAGSYGVAKANIEGASGGQKLSTDFNQTDYACALRDIQEDAKMHLQLALEDLGSELEDFNEPWEIPGIEKYNLFMTMLSAYLKADEFTKGIALTILQNFVEKNFNITIKIDINAAVESAKEDKELMNENLKGDNENGNERGTGSGKDDAGDRGSKDKGGKRGGWFNKRKGK